jgi:hypothetical protein
MRSSLPPLHGLVKAIVSKMYAKNDTYLPRVVLSTLNRHGAVGTTEESLGFHSNSLVFHY